jgi:hypothetical protein
MPFFGYSSRFEDYFRHFVSATAHAQTPARPNARLSRRLNTPSMPESLSFSISFC